jgi:hypothetical protein
MKGKIMAKSMGKKGTICGPNKQHEETKTIEDKHQNGKRITEMKLTRKKDRKLRKKKANTVMSHEFLEDTS